MVLTPQQEIEALSITLEIAKRRWPNVNNVINPLLVQEISDAKERLRALESSVPEPSCPDITPKVQDLIFAARRVWKKYGHDESGIESDWTEWTDVRDALNALDASGSECAPSERDSQP